MNEPPSEPGPGMYVGIGVCMAGGRLGGHGPNAAYCLSRLGLNMSPEFFFPFLLFADILRLRVWIPSFFIVSGRFTCNKQHDRYNSVD